MHRHANTHPNMVYIHGKQSSNIQDIAWDFVCVALIDSWWAVQSQDLLMTLSTPSRRQGGGRACPEILGTSLVFSWLWLSKTKTGIIFQSRNTICSFEHLLSSHVFPLCPKPRSPGFTSLLSDSSARSRCRS